MYTNFRAPNGARVLKTAQHTASKRVAGQTCESRGDVKCHVRKGTMYRFYTAGGVTMTMLQLQ